MAAVQSTHTLRLLAAIIVVMLLRAAKTAMYSDSEPSSWQSSIIHVYDIPPVVLLTMLQLSAIGLLAKMYHESPSTVPGKVIHLQSKFCSQIIKAVHHRCHTSQACSVRMRLFAYTVLPSCLGVSVHDMPAVAFQIHVCPFQTTLRTIQSVGA